MIVWCGLHMKWHVPFFEVCHHDRVAARHSAAHRDEPQFTTAATR
jgi:hypothetical protein